MRGALPHLAEITPVAVGYARVLQGFVLVLVGVYFGIFSVSHDT